MQNDERIPNFASKFKSNNIWDPFGSKHCQKYAILDILPTFEFFGQKGGQMLFDLNFETRFGILSSNDE